MKRRSSISSIFHLTRSEDWVGVAEHYFFDDEYTYDEYTIEDDVTFESQDLTWDEVDALWDDFDTAWDQIQGKFRIHIHKYMTDKNNQQIEPNPNKTFWSWNCDTQQSQIAQNMKMDAAKNAIVTGVVGITATIAAPNPLTALATILATPAAYVATGGYDLYCFVHTCYGDWPSSAPIPRP